MNKKTIIILGSIIIVILVCCCLVLAGLMLWNYSETTNEISLGNVLGDRTTRTPTPYVIVKITGEAQDTENNPHQTTGEYANDVGLKLVDCSEKIGAFSEIATSITDNVNLIMDPNFIDKVNSSVDDIKNACTEIGQDENVPPVYAEVNEELQMADEAMYSFVENIHKGINDMDIEAISQALYDLASASSHYENANEMLSE